MTNSLIKYRKAIFAFLIIIAFIASLTALHGRIQAEGKSRTVEISMDYNSLMELCRQEGIDPDEAFSTMKEAGVTTLTFSEMSLNQLQEEGRLQWMSGSELIGLLSLSHSRESLAGLDVIPTRFYAFNYSPSLGKTLRENAVLMLGKDSVREIQIPGVGEKSESIPALELKGSLTDLPYQGLGFDPVMLGSLKQKGFLLALRPENRESMKGNAIKDYMAGLGKINGADAIIFGGQSNEAVGYPFDLPAAVEGIEESNLSFGDIEAPNVKSKQKGAAFIAQKLIDRVVRVQSITPLYLAKMTPEDAIDIFRLGVRERNIRFIYLRPYPRGLEDKTALETNRDYVSGLKTELEKYRFTIGRAARFPRRNPSPPVVVLISLAAAGVFLLLLDRVYHDRGIIALVVLILALLAPAALILIGKLHWAQKIIGLALGILFPTYAMACNFEEMEFIQADQKLPNVLGFALKMFLKITLVTITGALMLAALFSSTDYMLAVDQVRGIKLILFIPPLLVLPIYYMKGTNTRQTLKQILSTPLYLWQVAVLGILGAVGLLLAVRSGNAAGDLASTEERQLRVLMEQILWVRPRFKDFALGNPALVITWALSFMHRYAGLGLFVLFAAIGQADIMDTFSHVHTPVFISLVRTINGAVIGAIIGALAVTVYWFARKMSR